MIQSMSWIIPCDSDRFEKHRYLSISPTSTTVYHRIYDIQKNEYYRPIRVNEETGEINEIKPPVFQRNKGFLSEKAQRQVTRSVLTFMSMINENMLINGQGKENITFATLTLPSPQIKEITRNGIVYHATDKQIKRDCFNQLLIELKTMKGVDLNVWKAEKQLNGSIHFHILLDKYVDYEYLRIRWNSLINKFGFVDRYQQKMKQLTKEQYFELRKKENKKPLTQKKLESIEKAWLFGNQTNWTQPNSTDIERLHKVENVAAYISKYMSKEYGHTQREMKREISKLSGKIEINDIIAKQFYAIDGRIWQCSRIISKSRKCITECEDRHIEELQYMIKKNKDIKVFAEERFTTICHKFINLYTNTNEIFNHYINHIKGYVFSHIYSNLNSLYADTLVINVSPLVVQTGTNEVLYNSMSQIPIKSIQTQLNF